MKVNIKQIKPHIEEAIHKTILKYKTAPIHLSQLA